MCQTPTVHAFMYTKNLLVKAWVPHYLSVNVIYESHMSTKVPHILSR